MTILSFQPAIMPPDSLVGVVEVELSYGIVLSAPVYERDGKRWLKIPQHGAYGPALKFRDGDKKGTFKAAVLAALDEYEGEVR